MAASLTDILATLQNGVTAINALPNRLATAFVTSVSTGAVVGTVTFTSSQASAFGLVTTSSGGAYKVALYPSS